MNQNSPFAKGVSINQDIVMEPEPQNRTCNYDTSNLPKEIMCQPISGVGFRRLFHAINNQRHLLALGREEE